MTKNWKTDRLFFAYCPACKPFIEEGLKESLTITTTVGSCNILNSASHNHTVKITNNQLECRYTPLVSPITAVRFTNDARRQFLRLMISGIDTNKTPS
jgi:hypothetical protein